ncbi:AidA/PixA family protein [Kitasatospora sp. NPDC088351]|uniref:AidA/PixA family protein n=1 Tax=unclassified Kitasatospora TaxID=2633591 RepID=UPI00343524A6
MEPKKIIDILAMFDTRAILDTNEEHSRDAEYPTRVAPGYVHTVSPGVEFTRLSEGELYIGVPPGSFARWRETALPFDEEYSALMYRCIGDSELVDGFDPLVYLVRQPHPQSGDGENGEFDTDIVKGHAWGMRVAGIGSGDFEFHFQVVKGREEVVGYFSWPVNITFMGTPAPA